MAARGLTDAQIALRLGIRTGTVNSFWVRIRGKLGHFSRTEFASMTIKARAKDKIEQMAGVSENLERRLQSHESEDGSGQAELFGRAWEAVPLPVFACSVAGDFLCANRHFVDLMGYAHGELTGCAADSIFECEGKETFSRLLSATADQESSLLLGVDRPLYGKQKGGRCIPLVLWIGRDQGEPHEVVGGAVLRAGERSVCASETGRI